MSYFHIQLDMKFDELIFNRKNINVSELLELKEFIRDIYELENNSEYKSLKKSLRIIDFKI